MKNKLLLWASALPIGAFAQDNPNVVVIFVDQLSPWALSCYGNTGIKTPNIDTLADNGVIFNNAYCAKASSTPSRGCMLTGLYPFGHKATNNQMVLDTSVETYADVFNAAGYETAYMGKWHLAGDMGKKTDGSLDPRWNPQVNGRFKDATYMYNNGHWKNIVDVKGGVPKVSNNISSNPDEYGTDWIFQKGFDYISKHKGRSFCLVLSPPDPHLGFKVRKPYNTIVDKACLSVPESFYSKDRIDLRIDGNEEKMLYSNVEAIRANKAQYLGMVLCLDEYIGKLVSHLKKEGIYDNTMIVFTSDHGEMMGGYRRKGKAVPYNDAYQIPMIVKLPGKDKHMVVDALYNNIDFKPTVEGLLGLEVSKTVHGRDLSDYVFGKKKGTDDGIILLDFFTGMDDMPHAVVVNQDYWLAVVFKISKDKKIEGVSNILLYDRKKDKHQLVNLHGNSKYIDIERKMVTQMRDEMQRVDHPNLKDVSLIEEFLKL